jgi:hypothetical protein
LLRLHFLEDQVTCQSSHVPLFVPHSLCRIVIVNRLRFIHPPPSRARGLYFNLEEFQGLRSKEIT